MYVVTVGHVEGLDQPATPYFFLKPPLLFFRGQLQQSKKQKEKHKNRS